MGYGVPERDTYAARIERALNDPPGPVAYQVLNLGLAGLNATHVVERNQRSRRIESSCWSRADSSALRVPLEPRLFAPRDLCRLAGLRLLR